ncbi:MAG: TIGR03118 family protein [Acidobacteria bacterium]|nr:MAG: TIGR03118 family protein [Acidobacteriota bacterium]
MKAAVELLKSSIVLVAALALVPAVTFAQHYKQTNLVTDLKSGAKFTNDNNLKNPWGLTRSVTGPWWMADNNAGVSTLYDGTGAARSLVVTIPGPNGTVPCPLGGPVTPNCSVSAPTGIVFNGSPDFDLNPGDPSTAAAFIFATEDGTISAWAGGVAATLEVDHSAIPTAAEGAVYKGMTIGEFQGKRYLYVTNFRAGKVEVYDTNFKQVNLSDEGGEGEESFDDERIPKGFAPFNIQNIGGSLFVTYAKQDQTKHDDVPGAGLGFVDIFSPSGKLLTRFEHGSWLNAPWGVVWTPRDFGEFSNNILVGNFGSGQIAAYNGFTGQFMGLMRDQNDQVLSIDGLWGLAFGNSAAGCPSTPPMGSNLPKCGAAGPYNNLFFTAGINGEADGLFGTLTPDPNTNELGEADEL